MPLKAVTFDFHNTLADCDEWFQLEIREIVPAVMDWLASRDGTTVAAGERDTAIRHYRAMRLDIMEHGNERDAYDCTMTVLAQMGRIVDEDVVREGVDTVMRSALPGSNAVEGVANAVRTLRASDIDLAVVSSAAHHDFLEWSLEKFEILDCFSHVITSASCGFYKSRTEIYQHALDQLGVRPSEAVHVGDSHRYDVETATRSGMRTVWFSRDRDANHANGAGLTVTSLDGLAPLILNHFGSDT
jgi:HAD superfamily hydrolase (TIGR01509 family)